MRTYVEEEEREETDTEITLGMKSLLGVFFGAVLVCGIFFGFGYSLGRNNAHPSAAGTANPAIGVKSSASGDSAAESNDGSSLKTVVSDPTPSDSTTPPSSSTSTADAKQYDYVPAPGGPARRPANTPAKDATAKPLAKPSPAAAGAATAPAPAPAYTKPSAAIAANSPEIPAPALTPAPRPQPPPQSQPQAQTAVLTAPRNAMQATSATPAAAGSTMVQIAAVTHQEDANILVTALRKRGYAVVVRNDPKDSLLHVQLGPFASRDEAKAMRTRLLSDGYNAILK